MAEFYTITIEPTVSILALRLPETLDGELMDVLNEQVLVMVTREPGKRWVLDMTEVHYAGSAALGFLVNVRQRVMSGGGTLVVFGLSAQLQQIFRDTSLERLFHVTRSRAEAMKP